MHGDLCCAGPSALRTHRGYVPRIAAGEPPHHTRCAITIAAGARATRPALPRFSARRNLGVIVRAGAMRLSHRCTEGFTAAMLHDGRVHSRARVRPGATS
ncbi:putative uncharacterized protein [Xanthomonas citri pv. mangiferaeindicae LMG 941]|nr:putative uncharacterized protein [Xanthomonas citri pv. mangiferaeindicae LMG 941]